MTEATLIPERLEAAKSLPLLPGAHTAPSNSNDPGEACFLEREGWIFGEEWGDCPPCVSPVLWRMGQRLNDRLPFGPRQELRQFHGRLGGTGGDGQDEVRTAIATRWVINTSMPQWLELIGLTARADELRSMEVNEWTSALSDLLFEVRNEVWKKYPAPRRELRQKVRKAVEKKLKEEGKPVVAVAAADAADAAADAAVAAVAAVAAADAAVVVAAVVAVVVAAVAADAAVVVAVAAAEPGKTTYDEVYRAVRDSEKVREAIDQAIPVVAEQRQAAFELFEQMIDPSAVVAA